MQDEDALSWLFLMAKPMVGASGMGRQWVDLTGAGRRDGCLNPAGFSCASSRHLIRLRALFSNWRSERGDWYREVV
jgi:hypothetical protein